MDGGAEVHDKECMTDDFTMCVHATLEAGAECGVAWMSDLAITWESEDMAAEMAEIKYFPDGDAQGSAEEGEGEDMEAEEEEDEFSDFSADFYGYYGRPYGYGYRVGYWKDWFKFGEKKFPSNERFGVERFSFERFGMNRDAHITEENFSDYCALGEPSEYASGTRLTVDETLCGNGIKLNNNGEEGAMFTVHMDGAVQNAALSLAATATVLFNLF